MMYYQKSLTPKIISFTSATSTLTSLKDSQNYYDKYLILLLILTLYFYDSKSDEVTYHIKISIHSIKSEDFFFNSSNGKFISFLCSSRILITFLFIFRDVIYCVLFFDSTSRPGGKYKDS